MRSAALLFVAVCVGCGGKIVEDPVASSSESSPSDSPSPSPPPPSASPFSVPSKASVEDACRTICERHGLCGAQSAGCYEECTGEIHSAAACSGEANKYIHCYADNLEGCAALPPVCEDAYCAFTRCAGRVVPTYCR